VTAAYFELSLDYVFVKILSWDLTKSSRVSRMLSSSMKGVGEVISFELIVVLTAVAQTATWAQ
jgi:carbamoyl-phosphate synthase/aspartate carbamoyltransferase